MCDVTMAFQCVNGQLYERNESQSGGAWSKAVRGTVESLVAGLFADDTVLLAENEGTLQRIVDEFDRMCKRRKPRVNAGKSKVVFERARQ